MKRKELIQYLNELVRITYTNQTSTGNRLSGTITAIGKLHVFFESGVNSEMTLLIDDIKEVEIIKR